MAKIFKNRPGPSSIKTKTIASAPQPGHLHSSLHACQTYLAVPIRLRGCCWMLAAISSQASWASAAMHQLRPSCLAAGLLLAAASALAKRGQVMFRPQPLHQLPSLGICAYRCISNRAGCPSAPFLIVKRKHVCEPAAQSRRRQDGPHATPALEMYRALKFYWTLIAKIFKNRPGANHVLPPHIIASAPLLPCR